MTGKEFLAIYDDAATLSAYEEGFTAGLSVKYGEATIASVRYGADKYRDGTTPREAWMMGLREGKA